MILKTMLVAAAACAIALGGFDAYAQGRPAPRGESRLPKGVRGLDEGQAKPPSANWLLDAKDDQERFRRIQIYAGGTYEQMWQIGYRYQQAFLTERGTCMACHIAEKMPFLNDTPIFRDTASFPVK